MTSTRPGPEPGATVRHGEPSVAPSDVRGDLPPFEEVGIDKDIMFRSVFAHDKPLFVRLIWLLLEFEPNLRQLDAGSIELEGNAELQSDPGARTSELDVYCKAEGGPVIDVEMQAYRQKLFLKRLRTYLSSADRDAWLQGEYVDDIRDVVGVAVCTFDPIGLGRVRYVVRSICEGTDSRVDDGRTVVLYNARAASWEQCEKEGIGHDLCCFLRYVAGYHDEEVMGSEFVRDVDKRVRKCRQSESLRREYMSYVDDMQHFIEVGEARGEARGEAKGRSEERGNILAAVAQAFAAGELTTTALALLGFTEDECRSALAASQQA